MSAKKKQRARGQKPGGDGRYASYLVLLDVLERDAWAQFSLQKITVQLQLEPRERQLASALVYRTLEQYAGLKYRLEKRIKRGWKKLDLEVRVSLLLGLSQTLYFERIPDSAAVNESVKLVRGAGKASAGGFVNGVLRGLIREPVNLPKHRPDLQYGISPWMWGKLTESLGPEEASAFMEAVNRPEPLSIRLNRLKLQDEQRQEDLLQSLSEDGFKVTASPLVPHMYRLAGSAGLLLTERPEWEEGLFTIQGEGAALAAYLLDVKPGIRVLDACAAPGGKTALIAELMHNEGQIFAGDLQQHRLQVMSATLDRLGADAKLLESDAAALGSEDAPEVLREGGTFDRVLADVPCSNWGNLGSKPELRWRGDDEGLAELEALAGSILRASARMVKPGGRLVYSTCTLNKGENQDLVEAFVRDSNGSWELVPAVTLPNLSTGVPNADKRDRIMRQAESGQLTLLPQHEGVPGFYIAVLERRMQIR